MKLMRLIYTFLLFTSLAFSQSLAVGVKGGVPFRDAFSTKGVYSGESQSWTAGPTVELRLPFGLGAEFDALYRKTAYRVSLLFFRPEQATSSQWQFPLLAKFRFPSILVHPYVDGGVVFNKLTSAIGFGPTAGAALGGGAELKLGKIRVGPELRYTRWSAAGFPPNLSYNQNQVDLLIGVTWGK